jgi:hypothetical protein
MAEYAEKGTFRRLFNGAKVEAFRLEQLNVYISDDETSSLDKFLKTGEYTKIDGQDEWLDGVEALHNSGVRYVVLHVVDFPLSGYMRFLSAYYTQFAIGKGEEVFLLDRRKAPLYGSVKDFWLFDDKTFMAVNYDANGRFLGMDAPTTDRELVKRAVTIKKELLAVAALLK